mgnify:CR=1 FL=1
MQLSIGQFNLDGVTVTIEPTLANLQPLSSQFFKATIEISENVKGPVILRPDDNCPTPTSGFGGNGNPRVAWGCGGDKKKEECDVGKDKPHNEISDLCESNCCSVDSCGVNEC